MSLERCRYFMYNFSRCYCKMQIRWYAGYAIMLRFKSVRSWHFYGISAFDRLESLFQQIAVFLVTTFVVVVVVVVVFFVNFYPNRVIYA